MGALAHRPSVTFGPTALALLAGLALLGGIGGIVAASVNPLMSAPAPQPAPSVPPTSAVQQADEMATAAFINQVALSHVSVNKLADVVLPPAPKPVAAIKKPPPRPPVRTVAMMPPPRPLTDATPVAAASEGFLPRPLVVAVDYLPSPRRVADNMMKQAGRLWSW